MKYNKLVRDYIPEIIKKNGGKAITRTLTDEEFKEYLEKKLDEEVAEFHESKSIEELADVMQVVMTLAVVYGYYPQDVLKARIRKLIDRGGFDEKTLLIETLDKQEE